jgi:phosphoglycolate phosphatase-like HAD superfamily hydrolase
MTLFVLDFDGVLVHPYTDPEEFFPHALATCAHLVSLGFKVAVVSSNPRAYFRLSSHIGKEIHTMRARSADKWWLAHEEYDDHAAYALSNHKGLMIASILAELGDPGINRLVVVEDKVEKAAQVLDTFRNWSGNPQEALPTHAFTAGVTLLVVPSNTGLPSWAALTGL